MPGFPVLVAVSITFHLPILGSTFTLIEITRLTCAGQARFLVGFEVVGSLGRIKPCEP